MYVFLTDMIMHSKLKEKPQMLSDLEGEETIINNILVYERTNSECDERLKKTLERIKQGGIELDEVNCKFNYRRIEYFRHLITKDKVQPNNTGDIRIIKSIWDVLFEWFSTLDDSYQM